MKYIGKDYIRTGHMILLDKNKAWEQITKRARNGISRAKRIKIKVVESRDTKLFSTIHILDKIPPLEKEERMFLFYIQNKLAGGIIVIPITKNILFHRREATTKFGKRYYLSYYMLWYVVEKFTKSQYKYLDLGASYRESLQFFFQKFSTKTYPIIFNPPRILPSIKLTPFTQEDILMEPKEEPDDKEIRLFFNNKNLEYFPSGRQAIKSILIENKLSKDDVVSIFPTYKTEYVSGCVTKAIESICKWSMKWEKNTKAVIILHEWGIPNKETKELIKEAKKRKCIVIEDCALSINSKLDGKKIGGFGDYAVYSLPKIFNMQYGGIATNMKKDDKYIWDNYQCLDVGKRRIIKFQLLGEIRDLQVFDEHRIEKFILYSKLFADFGLEPYFKLKKDEVPYIFMLKTDIPYEIQERGKQFGVEIGVYHNNNAVFLPVHQNISKQMMHYIVGLIRAMFRFESGL